MSKEVYDLAVELKSVQEELAHYKQLESKLRIELADAINLETLKVGMNKIENDNLIIKATRKVNHSVDQALINEAWDSLDEESKSAFSWKAALSLKVYKQLADTDIIDDFIEVKPAMPAISIQYIGE